MLGSAVCKRNPLSPFLAPPTPSLLFGLEPQLTLLRANSWLCTEERPLVVLGDYSWLCVQGLREPCGVQGWNPE